jgi:hypothetical protein
MGASGMIGGGVGEGVAGEEGWAGGESGTKETGQRVEAWARVAARGKELGEGYCGKKSRKSSRMGSGKRIVVGVERLIRITVSAGRNGWGVLGTTALMA